ncbi:hypothetical protein V2G26_021251 [Clonostachys chloroleuca]
MANSSFESWAYEEQEEYLYQPAMEAPEGLVSNLDDPPQETSLGFSVTVACTVIAGLALLLRIYSYAFFRRRLALQDLLALFAMTTFGVMLWPGYFMTYIGALFVHQWDIDRWTLADALYMGHIAATMYILTMFFAQSAILLELIRIFIPGNVHIFIPGHTHSKFFWVCRGTQFVVAIYWISVLIFQQFWCRPLSRAWSPWASGSCIDRKVVDKLSAYINIFIDLIIYILPQTIIWRLNSSVLNKTTQSLAFSFALISLALAIARSHNMHSFVYDGDTNYSLSSAYMWALGECLSVILVYCAPSVYHIITDPKMPPGTSSTIQSARDKFRSSATKSTSTSNGNRWQGTSSNHSGPSSLPHENRYQRMEDTELSQLPTAR